MIREIVLSTTAGLCLYAAGICFYLAWELWRGHSPRRRTGAGR